ncbi:MAG: terminase small subunit [Acidobacteria bacterium]|nr:terminase small subunit [Acidobacteriota bacterium]
MASGLTQREFAFVTAFLGPARGNATEAAALAGYARTRKAQGEEGYRLLKKPHIQRAIVARRTIVERKAIADADEVDTTVTRILRSPAETTRDRLRAAGELNKVMGRHSVTHHVQGRLSLEDALDLVTKKRATL